MSESFWVPVRFKGQQVFAESDAAGQPTVRGGRVAIVYNLGASKSYSTYIDRLERIAGAEPQRGASPAPGGGQGTAKKKKGKSNSEILGGVESDLAAPEHIHLWGDGACSGNPGPAGAGTVLIIDDVQREFSTWLGEGTNNIAELVAIQQGLQAIPRPVERTVVVHTDSQYSMGVLARGWKAKANQALIGEIRAELEAFPSIIWHWVRGHVGVDLNERCDELARQAISARSSTDRRV